jgi:hypothetical protein
MTVLYGSDAVPKRVFGEGALLDLFETTAFTEMPAVWELNKAFLRMWNPEAYDYQWVLPDNFHVKTKVKGDIINRVTFMGQTVDVHTKVNEPQPQGRSIGANVTHSLDGYIVREMGRRCNYDRAVLADVKSAIHVGRGLGSNRAKDRSLQRISELFKASGLLSARCFDYIDRENIDLISRDAVAKLIETLPAKPFPILANHDCFRVHPNYGNDLRLQYNRQLAELSDSTILNFVCTQLLGVEVNTKKLALLNSSEILSSEYALS